MMMFFTMLLAVFAATAEESPDSVSSAGSAGVAASEVLVVKTQGANTRGMYTRQPDDFGGFPVWRCDACSPHPVFLFRAVSAGKYWLVASELGGSDSFHSSTDAAKLPADAAGWDEGVVVLKPDAVKPDLAKVPDQMLGISKVRGFQGLYRRGDDHDFYPTYQNQESQLWLWHDLFQDIWLLNDAVSDSQNFYWRVTSNAASPLQVTLTDDDEFERFDGVPGACSTAVAADEVLVVKSSAANTRGLYARQPDDFRGFPVWRCDACSPEPLFLFRAVAVDKNWLVGSELRSPDIFHSATDAAEHPADAVGWSEGVVVLRADAVKPDLATVPDQLLGISNIDMFKGLYCRGAARDFYPTYQNQDSQLWLWHDLFQGTWQLTDSDFNGNKFYWRVNSGAASPVQVVLTDNDQFQRFEASAFHEQKCTLRDDDMDWWSE